MNKAEEKAMLRGAAWMREKIAQALEKSPVKKVHESGAHVRTKITLPKPGDVEYAGRKWLDKVIDAEQGGGG